MLRLFLIVDEFNTKNTDWAKKVS